VNGLQAQFGDRIEFVVLNVDDPNSLPLRQQFDLVQRSRYALVGPDGQTVEQRWFGLLNEGEVADYLSRYLADLP